MFCGLSISAQNTVLVIHQKTGGTVNYSFTEKPVIVYEGDNMSVTTLGTCVEYPISNLIKFTFVDEANAIENISYTLPDGSNDKTFIYSVNGSLLKSIEPEQKILLNDLNQGVYIIKNGKSTYKIIKK